MIERGTGSLLPHVFGREGPENVVHGRGDPAASRTPSGSAAPANAAGLFDTDVRRRAREAAMAVPDPSPGTFPAAFTARSRVGDEKRRLILHAGTPKTGTSSLQHYLDANRGLLAERGWWYPPTAGEDPAPRHQWISQTLAGGDGPAFVSHAEAALRGMPDHAHTIVFSTEGVFNHWWDYTPEAKGLLRDLAGLFDFELCVCFRRPDEFAASYYVQMLRNPRISGAGGTVYGRDLDFTEAMQDEWFCRHFDYLGFYHEAQALFGRGRVAALAYSGDVVRAFLEQYGIDLPAGVPRENVSLRRPGVEMLRIINRYGLEGEERERVLGLVREIDGVIGERAERFRLRAAERALVARHAQRGWDVFRQSSFLADDRASREPPTPGEPGS